jgi:hypothetical protein
MQLTPTQRANWENWTSLSEEERERARADVAMLRGDEWESDEERELHDPHTPSQGQPTVGAYTPPTRVALPGAFWWLAVLALLILLWGAAEVHDQSCYSKTAVQVASGNLSQSNCLILPWNDPVTGREQNTPFR